MGVFEIFDSNSGIVIGDTDKLEALVSNFIYGSLQSDTGPTSRDIENIRGFLVSMVKLGYEI